MDDAFNERTSKTLLDKLRVFDDHQAWARFWDLYPPRIQAWARRFGLGGDDVDELTSRLLAKLVKALPHFEYDPQRGSFRGWLKTLVMHEIDDMRRKRQPDAAVGTSTAWNQLQEVAAPVDQLVDGLHDCSEELYRCVQDALAQVQAAAKPGAWVAFQRTALLEEPIGDVAAALGLSYGATAMQAHRLRQDVKARIEELAVQRGLLGSRGQ